MNKTPLFTRLFLALFLISLPVALRAEGPGCGGKGCRKRAPRDEKPPKGPGCGSIIGCAADFARAAVKEAVHKAEANEKKIAELQAGKAEDAAAVALVMPYASENEGKPAEGFGKALAAKRDFWQAVLDSLEADRKKAGKRGDAAGKEPQLGDAGDEIKGAMALTRQILLARAVVDDISQDEIFFRTGAKDTAGLLKRKAALFQTLAASADKSGATETTTRSAPTPGVPQLPKSAVVP